MYYENIILGCGPSALQLGYYFEKQNIEYIILEKENNCGSFFYKFPISDKLISLNKKYTGEENPDFNLRHDWNSLLNDENFLFTDLTDELYPSAEYLHRYLNEFSKKFNIKINFNQNVLKVNKKNSQYEIITNDQTYICNKLIIATGLSKPNYPKNIIIPSDIKINHYGDINKKEFIENIKNYCNKKVLLIGGGNASYELANLLEKYCSTVIILGSNKKMSIVSHYVGDIRSIYLPFLDGFYLKSLNGIDGFNRNGKYTIRLDNDPNSQYYKKYRILNTVNEDYYDRKLKYFDDIIFCTGWEFDKSIFDFKVSTVNNEKYPEINEIYESTNNTNLYFIGSLMHSRDFKKGSGGFIHGFRYLIKMFTQLNFNLPKNITEFKFTGNMDCYTHLAKHMFNRINNASSLYQLYGTMCDIFYYDKTKNSIIYLHDWKLDCIKYLNIDVNHINCLILEYGEEEIFINKLGGFDKWNPRFLHPKIYLMYCDSKTCIPQIVDRVIFEEDLIADFNSDKIYNKIYQTIKMCNLVI